MSDLESQIAASIAFAKLDRERRDCCINCGALGKPNFDGQCDQCGGRAFVRARDSRLKPLVETPESGSIACDESDGAAEQQSPTPPIGDNHD